MSCLALALPSAGPRGSQAPRSCLAVPSSCYWHCPSQYLWVQTHTLASPGDCDQPGTCGEAACVFRSLFINTPPQLRTLGTSVTLLSIANCSTNARIDVSTVAAARGRLGGPCRAPSARTAAGAAGNGGSGWPAIHRASASCPNASCARMCLVSARSPGKAALHPDIHLVTSSKSGLWESQWRSTACHCGKKCASNNAVCVGVGVMFCM